MKNVTSELVVYYLDNGTVCGRVGEWNNWMVTLTICPGKSLESTIENNYEENTK